VVNSGRLRRPEIKAGLSGIVCQTAIIVRTIMTKGVYRLTNPGGSEMELPVRQGTIGPDVIEIDKLYGSQGVITYDPGFEATDC